MATEKDPDTPGIRWTARRLRADQFIPDKAVRVRVFQCGRKLVKASGLSK